MTKIIIDDAIPYVKGVLEPWCEVVYLDGRNITPGDVADADALMIRTRTRCDEALLDGSSVRAIATATIGYDHIDTDYCRAGIGVFTAAGCNARGVLQWFGAVLDHDSRALGWEPSRKRVGVVGTGNVGQLSARYAALWGFEVLCCDPPRQKAGLPSPTGDGYHTLEQLARTCDIVTFHTPLTFSGDDPTYHMAAERFFDTIRPGSLILNASRGEVADTRFFLEAIRTKGCRAAVDTWEHEPDIDRDLLARATLATPHIAGYTAQGKANASAMSVDALARLFDLPLEGWFPHAAVERIAPRDISWEEMRSTIRDYFNIEAESRRLKANPGEFELTRTEYTYREEYF